MAEIIHKLFGQKHGKHSEERTSKAAGGASGEAEGYTKHQHDFCEYSIHFKLTSAQCFVKYVLHVF